MTLLVNFLYTKDIVLFPICFLVFFFIIRAKANNQKEERLKKLYYQAFYFKVVCVILFTLISQFYFKGGDTNLYYQATKDLRAAIADNQDNIWTIIRTDKLTINHPLTTYFYYDNFEQDITYNYMISASNFLPGKLALLPSLLFGNSYICINMFFGFFALGGAIRLFKTFYYFYPRLWRHLAVACLFLPGVAFWSAALLKDPITFGCIGFILYALIQIIFRKQKIAVSVIWILICCYLLFNIKIYILLVLALSLVVWFFAEFNKSIKEKVLRYIFTALTFAGSAVVGYLLLNYLTSLDAAREYKLDTLLNSAETQRRGYEIINQTLQGDSHFTINAGNPVLLFFGSIVATFFRPFIWEINTPIALLSAFESAVFLFLTLYVIFKRGLIRFFTVSFSDGRILMCFIFAFVFAFAVGSSTANFGALSRYKIPCTPFYLLFLLLLYNKKELPLPRWFERIVDFAVPLKKTSK
ncbi:MAG: hypothetical protein HZB42_09320 [Sphingobacteriales bacterium]|nr:hypothetical protein [Sphingobacteriales bacterium]